MTDLMIAFEYCDLMECKYEALRKDDFKKMVNNVRNQLYRLNGVKNMIAYYQDGNISAEEALEKIDSIANGDIYGKGTLDFEGMPGT